MDGWMDEYLDRQKFNATKQINEFPMSSKFSGNFTENLLLSLLCSVENDTWGMRGKKNYKHWQYESELCDRWFQSLNCANSLSCDRIQMYSGNWVLGLLGEKQNSSNCPWKMLFTSHKFDFNMRSGQQMIQPVMQCFQVKLARSISVKHMFLSLTSWFHIDFFLLFL